MFHDLPWHQFHALPVWAQRVLLLVAVYIVGRIVVRIALHGLKAFFARNDHLDVTLEHFITGVAKGVGWALLIMVLLATAGFDIGALLGGLAIGGFILGFALKDTLGNLAAGVLLQFNRPIAIGETVTIGGDEGDVVGIGMALTTLKAADGRIITVPNGNVIGSSIINHSRLPIRRADVLVGIGYGDDIDVAVKAIMDALHADPRVLRDPEASVRITNLGDNAVGLQVRPWVIREDFWKAKTDFHQVVKRALDEAGCTIPYPQRDVHMYAQA